MKPNARRSRSVSSRWSSASSHRVGPCEFSGSRSWRSRLPLPFDPLMCGIVGYVGDRPCRDLLIAGLEKLEYRGYDSAGISVLSDGEIDSVRAVGNLSNLRAAVEQHSANGGGSVAVAAPPATIGLGH